MTLVLLGTAGHKGSEDAAAWAADLARLLRGDSRSSRHTSVAVPKSRRRSPATSGSDAAAELDRWASAHQLGGVALRTMQRSPHEAIAQAADDSHADIVVIGSKPVEGETSLGFGSVAHRLAHHLSCPMIVVPPGAPPLGRGTVVIGVDGTRGSDRALQWGVRLGRAIDGRIVAVFAMDKFYDTFQSGNYYGSGRTMVPTPGPLDGRDGTGRTRRARSGGDLARRRR